MESRSISLVQLAKHNTQQDLWVAVHGKVYDLTAFATDHPGGIEVLEECAGTDGTEPYEYAGHNPDALAVLDRFQVGMLEGHGASPQTGSSRLAVPLPLRNAGAVVTGMRRAWGLARSRSLLSLLALLVAARLFWKTGPVKTETDQSIGPVLRPANAFVMGILVASSVGFAGLAAAYSRLRGTLRQEKEVFAYPSVITVRR